MLTTSHQRELFWTPLCVKPRLAMWPNDNYMNTMVVNFLLLAILSGLILVLKFPTKWELLRGKAFLIIFAIWLAVGATLSVDYFNSLTFFNAVRSGDMERVKKLLSEKPSLINSRTIWTDKAPVNVAVASGNDQMVAYLLESGADVNTKDFAGLTPLNEAADCGNVLIAQTLLKAGADVNTTGYKQAVTPLMVAAIRGFPEMAKLLLLHGANVKARAFSIYIDAYRA